MQRDRDRKDGPFGLGDSLSGFRGFGRSQSLMSSFFGRRDPFDDPFLTSPLESMFGSRTFNSRGNLFGEASNSEFSEQKPKQQNTTQSQPIIQEISSDDEDGDDSEREHPSKEKQSNYWNHSKASKGPYVQDPDDKAEANKKNQVQYRNENRTSQQKARTYSFQSSSVTYGGINGAYYTSSTTRRTGSDGVMVEERKEADTTTGKATHRISRAIQDKGHSLTRKLNSDGKVETLQTLHNLNEDELAGFEEAWKGNTRDHLPGLDPRFDLHDDGNMGNISTRPSGQVQALPSTEQASGYLKSESQKNWSSQ